MPAACFSGPSKHLNRNPLPNWTLTETPHLLLSISLASSVIVRYPEWLVIASKMMAR